MACGMPTSIMALPCIDREWALGHTCAAGALLTITPGWSGHLQCGGI